MTSLRPFIRQVLLTEEVFGAQAFVYHGSDAKPDVLIPALLNDTFRPGPRDAHGSGLYTVYDLEDSATAYGQYGQYIYKLKINIHGFIIFDEDVCIKVYGKPMSVNEQLLHLGEDSLADKYKDYENWNHIPGKSNEWGNYSSDLADMMAYELSKVVKGIIFTDRSNGKVAVIYDPSIVVPVSWQHLDPESGLKDDWNKIDRKSLKPALKRSAAQEFEKNRYGTKMWKNKEGKLHRVGGPAIIHNNGTKIWYYRGQRHRISGPAVTTRLGGEEYWIYGRQISKNQWERAVGRS